MRATQTGSGITGSQSQKYPQLNIGNNNNNNNNNDNTGSQYIPIFGLGNQKENKKMLYDVMTKF